MDEYGKPKPQQVGVQISRCVHSQVPEKDLYGELRPHLGDVFRKLALQKESRVEEGHLMLDHVHMMISSFHQNMRSRRWFGFIKGKSAIHLPVSMGRRSATL